MNINDFYNPHDIRPYLAAPFKLGNKIVACDGASLVTMPEELAPELPATTMELPERVTEILTDYLKQIEEAELKPMETPGIMPDLKQCDLCDGTGKTTKKECPECNGWGEAEAETEYNTYEVECKSCDGQGHTIITGGDGNCPQCNGNGKHYPSHTPVQVHDHKFDANMLKRIINEPGLMVKTTDHALLFKTGPYSGVLLKLRD